MNIFQLSIGTIVFASTLLLGTTAVIASRFLITTVAGLTRPAAAAQPIVVPAAEPERIVDLPDLRKDSPTTPDDFEPSGSYSLDTETAPAAFADIEFLEIVTTEFGYDAENATYTNVPIIPTGRLQTKKTFSFTKISIGVREISFETTAVKGISYRFVGDFPVLIEAIDCETCEHPPNLKGSLKKLKNGKVIAEMDAKFYYYDAC